MNKSINIFFLLFLVLSVTLYSQEEKTKTIQFSGVVITEDLGEMVPLPYTTISVKGTSRGVVTDIYGFFSMAAREGEIIEFSRVGFKTVQFQIPDTLKNTLYSVFQIMTEDTILLPETVIYPWPSKEHFEIEFLAMDVQDEAEKAAKENLAEEMIEEMIHFLPPDGREATNFTISTQAAAFKYTGQYKPQNIFNPLAWREFIKAWKRGDFKKKR